MLPKRHEMDRIFDWNIFNYFVKNVFSYLTQSDLEYTKMSTIYAHLDPRLK